MAADKSKKQFDPTYPFLILVLLALGVLAWKQGGWELVLQGFRLGGATFWSVIPLLIAAFLIAGLIQVLVSPQLVQRWLGRSSGWRGILLACLGGALIPGGPYVYYPIAAVLLHNGASLGVMVAFVSAKNLWSISRLPLEFALLGSQLTVVRFAATLLIPPLMGILSELLLGAWVEEIRKAVRV